MAATAWMARALELAGRGRYTTHPNPRVGCVIVRDGEIVGEGWHERAGEPHAEIHALRAAGERARGAEAYITLEPCRHHGRTGPCTEALIAAGVRRVYAAMRDPNPRVAGQGAERLRAAGVALEFEPLPGAAELNRGFVSRMQRGRPFVTLKLAASLDGRTAMASGESKWITGLEARADVHRLRAAAGAVLTSADTVLADDPELNIRGAGLEAARVPDRIVLDARARVPASAKVWKEDGARKFRIRSPLAACGPQPAGVRDLVLDADPGGHVGLDSVQKALAQEEVNEVLVECGPRLTGALLQQKQVDEIVLYLAPTLLGHDARPLAVLPGLEQLSQQLRFRIADVRAVGSDLRLTLSPE